MAQEKAQWQEETACKTALAGRVSCRNRSKTSPIFCSKLTDKTKAISSFFCNFACNKNI